MSRTRRILGGTAVAYLHQATIVLVGLWLTPFLLRHLGQQQLGLWLVLGQLLGYLLLMDLGVIAILPREVAFASGQGEQGPSLIASLLARVRQIVRWQVLALSVLSLLLWWFLPAQWTTLKWPLAIVLVSFVTLYPARVDTAALQGAQELTFLAAAQMVGWLASTLTTIVLVMAGWGIYALVLGWAAQMAIPSVVAVYKVRTRFRAIQAPGEAPPVGAYFKRSMWVSVSQISQVLLNGSDVLILGKLLGAAAVVPYACTGKLVTVFGNHPQLLMHAAQPALSELRGSASSERLGTTTTALTQVMLMMSGAIAIMILPVNRFFVSWWVGPTQYGGAWLTLALAVMMLLRHWNVATIYTLFCFGYERQLSLTGLIDGVVTAAGTALLVWKWGPIGAPIASIIGVVAVSLPRNVISVAHELHLAPLAFLRTLWPLLARIVGVGLGAATLSWWLGSPSLAGAVVTAIPTGLLYVVLVLPLAWNGPVGPYLRRAIPFLDQVETHARLDRWLVRPVCPGVIARPDTRP